MAFGFRGSVARAAACEKNTRPLRDKGFRVQGLGCRDEE